MSYAISRGAVIFSACKASPNDDTSDVDDDMLDDDDGSDET